jgi:hypothetical protein
MDEEIVVTDLERESLYQKPRRRWIINTETYPNGRAEGGCGLDYFLRLFERTHVFYYALLLVHGYNYVGR